MNVRKLTDNELGEVQAKSTELAALLGQATAELRDLLRVPFNLRLLAELLGTGFGIDQLTPIRTQLELFDKYWRYRVLGTDGEGDARESIVRRACEAMTAARVLHVDRAQLAEPAGSQALSDLLSSARFFRGMATRTGTGSESVRAFVPTPHII